MREKESHFAPETEKEKTVSFLNVVDLDSGEIQTYPLNQEDLEAIAEGKREELLSAKDIEQILRIDEAVFGSTLDREWLYGPEDIRKIIRQARGPQFLFKRNNELVGYLLTRPATEAYQEFAELGLLENDPDFSADPKLLYIDDFAGQVGVMFIKVFKMLEEQARSLGYTKIGAHGINEKLWKLLAKRGYKIKREIADWMGAEARYLEKDLYDANDTKDRGT